MSSFSGFSIITLTGKRIQKWHNRGGIDSCRQSVDALTRTDCFRNSPNSIYIRTFVGLYRHAVTMSETEMSLEGL
jgi:hypothetical protein